MRGSVSLCRMSVPMSVLLSTLDIYIIIKVMAIFGLMSVLSYNPIKKHRVNHRGIYRHYRHIYKNRVKPLVILKKRMSKKVST